MLTTIMAISIAAACIIALPLFFGIGGLVVLAALFAWFFCGCATYDNCRQQYEAALAEYEETDIIAKYHNGRAQAFYQAVLVWVLIGLVAYTWWYFLRQPWYSVYYRGYLYPLTAASVITIGQAFIGCHTRPMQLLDSTIRQYEYVLDGQRRLRTEASRRINTITQLGEQIGILIAQNSKLEEQIREDTSRQQVLEEQIRWQAGELKTLRLHLSPSVEAEEEEETAPPFVKGVMRVQEFTNPGA